MKELESLLSRPNQAGPSDAVQAFSPPADELGREELLSDYLDRICAPLVPEVPFTARQELKRELAAHLDALAEAYEELGMGPREAMRSAVVQFGDPRKVASEWAAEWRKGQASLPEPLLPAYRAALWCFGGATAFTWIGSAALFRVGAYGDNLWLLAAGILAPLVAGFGSAFVTRGRSGLASFLAAATMNLGTACYAGLHLLPWANGQLDNPGLGLAFVQFVFWLPLGALAGTVGAFLRNRTEQRLRTVQ